MVRKSAIRFCISCGPWKTVEHEEMTVLGFTDRDGNDEIHNFCRNPDGNTAPWCYNGEGDSPEWEHCDLPFCNLQEPERGPEGSEYPECRLSQKGKEYVGTKNATETGKPCLRWTSRPYGMPWDFFDREVEYAQLFLNMDPAIHENYCRNSGLYREKPWCFVSDPDIQREYCHDSKKMNALETRTPRDRSLGSSFRLASATRPRPMKALLAVLVSFLSMEAVASRDFVYRAIPVGQTYEDVASESTASNLATCGIACVRGSPRPCFAFNYRGSDGTCQLVRDERSRLVEADGFLSFVSGEQQQQQHTYPECRTTERGREYVGTTRVTESGKACLRWDSQPYGIPGDFSDAEEYGKNFPNLDVWSQKNFCRNPSGKARPWCFVSDPQLQWEHCDIPMCTDP
ncbi:unnamed protein product, partial [Darwinula stevensoni]